MAQTCCRLAQAKLESRVDKLKGEGEWASVEFRTSFDYAPDRAALCLASRCSSSVPEVSTSRAVLTTKKVAVDHTSAYKR